MLWTPIWPVRLQRPCLGHQRLLAAVAAVAPTGLLADVSAAALPPGCSQSGQTVTCTYAPGQISRSRCQRACPRSTSWQSAAWEALATAIQLSRFSWLVAPQSAAIFT